MHEGRRITDAATLDIAVMAYAGLANKRVVAAFAGARRSMPAAFRAVIWVVVVSHRRPVGEIDWGYVGDVEHVRADVLAMLLDAGVTPVISPITCSTAGELLNTNADSVASAVSGRHWPRNMMSSWVFTLDKAGVLLDVDDEGSLIARITPESYAALRAEQRYIRA